MSACAAFICKFKPRNEPDIEMDSAFLLLNIKRAVYVETVCMCDTDLSISGFMGIETLRRERQ